MFIVQRKRANGTISISIVDNVKVGKRTRQKTIRTIGHARKPEEVAILEQYAKEMLLLLSRKDSLPRQPGPGSHPRYRDVPDGVELNKLFKYKTVNNGIYDIFGEIYDCIGLGKLIGSTHNDRQWNDILKAMVLARIALPESKRKTARVLSRDYQINYSLDQYYRAMDKVIKFEKEARMIVLEETKRLHGGKLTVMLFDVTTLYFESMTQDELRDFGFSKDCKFKEVQVMLSLITTEKGYPVGYKLFPGNTSEGSTLIAHMEAVKKESGAGKVTLVADRAMFTEKNLKSLEESGIGYIVACKLKSLPKKEKEKITGDGDYTAMGVEGDLHWTKEYEHKKRRLVVSYSEKRARKDRRMRERLVERLMKKAKNGKVKAGDLIGNNGSKKYVKVRGKELDVDMGKMEEESKWDGLHGVVTDSKDAPLKILTMYRQLWRIEEAFRVNKHDLRMRPVYHWSEERVRAHILVCYLAFSASRFTMARINDNRRKQGKEPLSLRVCSEELGKMESVIMKGREGSGERGLYVVPHKPEELQREIYESLHMEYRERPFCL